MLLLRACLLWAIISANVVGGAFIFRRLFPRESPWLGFIVPEILFILLCNFIEHLVALPSLSPLFFIFSLAGLWTIFSARNMWRVMRLPSLLFLGLMGFTLLLRFLKPSIPDVRDGIPDLSLISAFCMGQTLPVDSTWIPPIKLVHYYFLEHYSASLVIRFFSLDIGTGFNVCAALLSTYIYFFIAGTAWHLSRGKLWVVLLTLFLTICAGSGATGYLWLTVKNLDPEDVANLYTRLEDPDVHIWLWKYLKPIDIWDRHELMVPGFWSWMGCYHSASAGQLLIGFSIFSLVEMVRPKRTDWPWICAAIAPLLMLVCCSWGMPLAGLFFLGGLVICWRQNIGPAHWQRVLFFSAASAVCLEPMLSYFFLWSAPPITLATGLHTQVAEFLVQWWPVYIPWLALVFIWRRLHPVTRLALILTPVAFGLVETFNVGQRYDTTGKLWGMIFGAAWITFVPTVAAQRSYFFRGILLLLVAGSVLSLCYWVTYYWKHTRVEDIAHLEGNGPLRWDPRKAKILEDLSQLKGQTIIPGKSGWAFCESAALAHFTLNRDYVSWSVFADDGFYTNGQGEAWKREVQVNDLYDGKNPNPLLYLLQRKIAALVIYPDDNISDEILQKLKRQLSPYFTYLDDRYGDPPAPPNAGVFLYQPQLIHFPPALLSRPAPGAAPPASPVAQSSK